MRFRIHKHAAKPAATILTDNGRDGNTFPTKPEEFWFVLVGDNGEIVMASEMLTRKQTAFDTIRSIQEAFQAQELLKIEDTTI